MDAQASGEGCALPNGGFLRFFNDLPDPRAANAVHRLGDILVIAVCAVICGADSWVDVETFGNAKLPWLSTFLPLPHGIPSHDTFGRVFAALDPEPFERCFGQWMAALRQSGTRLVAIDGKSIRRSFEHAWDASGMAHLVSAFAAENRLTFAQVAAAGKGQELAAMRQLLELLALDEATVVTIDALGCQRDIAQQIVAKEADYVLAVKENQPALYAAVKRVMDEALLENFDGLRHDHVESTCGDHGRIETRRVWVSDQAVTHLGEVAYAWPGLASVAVVESTRAVIGSGKPPASQRRYYISSIEQPTAQRLGEAIRGHWGIENSLHWQLDVSFGEDLRRVRKDHAAENFSRLCRIALNLLKSEKTAKIGVKGKRLKAGWDEPYLLRLLTG
jgi:predicted transposase YbfD/YdcC